MFVDGSRILFIYELNSEHKCRRKKESGDYVYLKMNCHVDFFSFLILIKKKNE